MIDVLVVGSGASGVGAALELVERGLRPTIVDVGFRPDGGATPVAENFYEYKARADSFDLTIGPRLQGLANHLGSRRVPVKLTVPAVEYVTRDAERIAPVDERDFSVIQSFAAGGLANAWGAGLYRFSERDLAGFPIDLHELDPYFDRLTRHIGIAGAEDDLAPFFGSTEDLLEPIALSRNMSRLYDAYRRRKPHDGGFHMGLPRLAVLSRPHRGRPAFEFHNLEFYQESPAVYTPRYSLDELIANDAVDYRPGIVVTSFRESDEGITVEGHRMDDGSPVSIPARRLLLAAGAVNSARIALAAAGDCDTELPLLENPAVQIPFVLLRSVGEALERGGFGLVGLNLVWDSKSFGALCQGSIMEVTAPMRAEFFTSLPYSVHSNLALLRHLLPAMFVMQFYLPGSSHPPSRMSLRPDGRLAIRGTPDGIDLAAAAPLFRFFRRLGAWSHRSLAVQVPMGHAVHYAGTLPMREDPGRYQCTPQGRLHGTRRVFVADSASFSGLPAKNMSFGMMANAMRVAGCALDGLER